MRDLAEQPAFRVALIRIGDERHRIVVTVHHVVADGWSLPIVVQQMFAATRGSGCPYRALSRLCRLAGRS
ncbi:condensation domain protein [Mycobacterium xenopi 3993]|nr:condensation domain protein [Mycobacterium xenopi 3993]